MVPSGAVTLDEDIILPTQKTLATLSVLEEYNNGGGEGVTMKRRASGDTIYYSISDGNIKNDDVPSNPVTLAPLNSTASPSKLDIHMDDGQGKDRLDLPESPLVRRHSNISKESLPQLAASSADRLEKLISNSPGFTYNNSSTQISIARPSDEVVKMVDPHGLAQFDAMVMTSTPQKSPTESLEEPFSPQSKPTYSTRDFEQLKREFEQRVYTIEI